MASFEIAYNLTSKNEGGYANDPQDKGGETHCGISRVFWPKWEGWKIIDEFKKAPSFPRNLETSDLLRLHVKNFYKSTFWDAIYLDGFQSQVLANELYDTSVNCGMGFEKKALQQSVWLLGHDVKIDGVINPNGETIRAVNQCNAAELNLTLNILQAERYKEICFNDPSQRKFFKGWLKRVSLNCTS